MTAKLERLVQELLSALESEKRQRAITSEVCRALDVAYEVENELRILTNDLARRAA